MRPLIFGGCWKSDADVLLLRTLVFRCVVPFLLVRDYASRHFCFFRIVEESRSMLFGLVIMTEMTMSRPLIIIFLD